MSNEELIKVINSMMGRYPMDDNAVVWYRVFHCSVDPMKLHHFEEFPGFENGWDSALQTLKERLKNA